MLYAGVDLHYTLTYPSSPIRPRTRPEIVVECVILLDDDDDVLHIARRKSIRVCHEDEPNCTGQHNYSNCSS
jgi:hypothetical protein